MLYRGFKKPIIKNGEYLYEVIGEYPPERVKDITELRKLLGCEITLRNGQNGSLLFCKKIQEAEIIHEEQNIITT